MTSDLPDTPPSRTCWGRLVKRIFDLAVAGIGAIVLSPLVLLAGLTILWADGWPVLFSQSRIGLGNKPFKLYKLRTMVRGAEKMSGGTVTITEDQRVLPFAGLIRFTKLDEAPQILNVLNGTMSIVGPRPTTPNDVERMSDAQRRRHDVLPGLTGLAQVNGNTHLRWPARIEYDLAYRNNWSPWLDFYIVMQTGFLILAGRADLRPIYADEWGVDDAASSSERVPNSSSKDTIHGGLHKRGR